MKAPKEIYVPIVDMGVEDGGIQSAPIWWNKDKSMEKQDCKGAVKYIRADLAELTWEDIEKIVDLYDDVYCDFSIDGEGGKTNTEEHYQEVLKRFKDLKHVK